MRRPKAYNRDVSFYKSVSKPKPSPTLERLLHVSNEYFTAGAIWVRVHGAWSCQKAAPILKWMVGMQFDHVPIELLKRGCRWSWSPITAGTGPQQGCKTDVITLKDSKHTAHENLTDPAYSRAGEDSGDAAGPISLQTGIGSESDRWVRQPLTTVRAT